MVWRVGARRARDGLPRHYTRSAVRVCVHDGLAGLAGLGQRTRRAHQAQHVLALVPAERFGDERGGVAAHGGVRRGGRVEAVAVAVVGLQPWQPHSGAHTWQGGSPGRSVHVTDHDS